MAHDTARPQPEPFQIRVPQQQLDDLQLRLGATRWHRTSKDSGWEHGTSHAFLCELVAYWQMGYDWRSHEARLNQLPQFIAEVSGSNVHFVHVRGRGPRPMPLLLLHGWPDSFLRYHKVLASFSDPAGTFGDARDAFDVVVPSLPGFAFSDPIACDEHAPRCRHTAQLMWQLMTQVLGHERFFVAGGDGGSVIAQAMAIDHPESVVGIHLTDLGWHALQVDPALLTRSERHHLDTSTKRFRADGAYAAVHMTRPRSLAAGLNDSPVGLASWIVDRFHSWCDFAHGLDDAVSKDDLLTNIMLYWLTHTIGSSIFNYYAEAQAPSLGPDDFVIRPVALALFPKDIAGIPPRSLAERTLNVQRWTEMPRGGHFAALEQPELYARDVIEFCRPLRRAALRRDREPRHVPRSL